MITLLDFFFSGNHQIKDWMFWKKTRMSAIEKKYACTYFPTGWGYESNSLDDLFDMAKKYLAYRAAQHSVHLTGRESAAK